MTMVIIALWVFVGIMLITGGFNAALGISRRITYGLPSKTVRHLSWPAREIVSAYNKLPESNKPYANILYVVEALDVKYGGKEAVDKRFTVSGYDSSYRSWRACHSCHRGCIHAAYKEIYDGINAIRTSLKEREHELEIAGVTDGLHAAKELTEALRQERDLIKETTKEIAGR